MRKNGYGLDGRTPFLDEKSHLYHIPAKFVERFFLYVSEDVFIIRSSNLIKNLIGFFFDNLIDISEGAGKSMNKLKKVFPELIRTREEVLT